MPYDVQKALKKYKKLISWYAWHYSTRGSFWLAPQDLNSEGLLVLVKCCQNFPKGQGNFEHYFKRSLNNRFFTMLRDVNRGKRDGKEVPLEDASAIPYQKPTTSFMEVAKERAELIKPYLSPDAKNFLEVLLENQNGKVLEEAWKDYCRKYKLFANGQRVKPVNRFRVRPRHLRKALNLSSSRMQELVSEIRRINFKMR